MLKDLSSLTVWNILLVVVSAAMTALVVRRTERLRDRIAFVILTIVLLAVWFRSS
jgi:hypothetical protein